MQEIVSQSPAFFLALSMYSKGLKHTLEKFKADKLQVECAQNDRKDFAEFSLLSFFPFFWMRRGGGGGGGEAEDLIGRFLAS